MYVLNELWPVKHLNTAFGKLVNGNNSLTALVKMYVTIVWQTFKYAILKAFKRPSYPLNACCPLKGHTYLDKPAAWIPGVKKKMFFCYILKIVLNFWTHFLAADILSENLAIRGWLKIRVNFWNYIQFCFQTSSAIIKINDAFCFVLLKQ